MSHFMLAQRPAALSRGPAESLDGRYGPEAMTLMLRGLTALGVDGVECEAKLFGGASMFPGRGAGPSIGRVNAETAIALLHAACIPVVSYSVFGTGHRCIVFDIGTGDVWSQRDGRERVTDTRAHDLEESAGTAQTPALR